MNPAFIDAMSWEMAEVYGAITDQILINLARHFPFYNAGDPLPSSAFEYQAAMLAQMGQVNRETISIIRRGLSDADDALQMVLEQSIIDSIRKAEPELLKAAQAGILQPAGVPIVAPGQMRAFQLYYGQAADKFNLVNTVMLESTQSAYRQAVTDVASYVQVRKQIEATQTALDIAAGETITGVSAWNQALRHATDRLNSRGITGFVDHAGRQWSAEAYVAMDIRTTAFNTARAAVWETNQNFGNDLYSVSYHQGARPLCYDWQNKVISANNRSGVTYDLDGNEIRVYAQSETTYGEPAGLFGINCKHYPTPFIPGVSVIEGKPQDPEDNEKTYKESQEQRRLERKLREEKRDYLTAKAQGRPKEELDLLREKCRATSGDIDQFCKETGRARHRDREGVYTKRDFPDKEKYNVADFERKQQEEIRQYFSGGGAQTGYNFGEMTPNEPIAPATPPAVPAPVTPIAPTAPTTPQDVASQATQTAENVVQSEAKCEAVKSAEAFGIERLECYKYTHQPSEEDIISMVGGGDRTQGSCASLSFAYAGQKNGIDVLDFRDGASRKFFASPYTGKLVLEIPGVRGASVDYGYMFTNAHKLMKQIEPNKEYIFTAGRHSAIVKKVDGVYNYLELQTRYQNGWHVLDDSALQYRFACSRSQKKPWDYLIEIDSLKGNKDFEELLEFINTEAKKQVKGIGGTAK